MTSYNLTLFSKLPGSSDSKTRLKTFISDSEHSQITSLLFSASIQLVHELHPQPFISLYADTLPEIESIDISKSSQNLLKEAYRNDRIILQKKDSFVDKFIDALSRTSGKNYIIGSDSPWWSELMIKTFIEFAGECTCYGSNGSDGLYLMSNAKLSMHVDFLSSLFNSSNQDILYRERLMQDDNLVQLPQIQDLDVFEDIPLVKLQIYNAIENLHSQRKVDLQRLHSVLNQIA